MSRIVVMTNKIAATETKPVRIRAFFPEAPRYNHATISYDDSKSTYENHEDAFLALAETHKLPAGEWVRRSAKATSSFACSNLRARIAQAGDSSTKSSKSET